MVLRTTGAGARLAALTLGLAALTAAAPAAPAAPVAAEPAPSARDVAASKERVQERAAEVGRTKARLAQASAELERLAASTAQAVERYNGELIMMRRALADYEQARLRQEEALRRAEEARSELAVFAADAYRIGGPSLPAVVAGTGGPQGFMDRAGMVRALARQRTGIIERAEAARNVAGLFQRQARAAFDERRDAAIRAAEARKAAERAVSQQRDAVRRIGAEQRSLQASLGKAQARALRLQRERQAALEKAEIRRAQEASKGAGAAAAAGSGTASRPVAATRRGSIVVRAALRWLGTPYSWGGGNASGPSYGIAHGARIHGFDCSGLALYAWAKAGVRLDHWTGTQWTSGPRVPLNRLRKGDLVFFARNTADPATIHHVGIFIGKGRMVEAPYTGARVRVSSIWRDGLIGAVRPAG
ncbi:NlpC/P60 family protein [Spirillospora sp. NPDC029432]|uniref:C40 family peptidase n=1 Tax=Spirillospora sp. NPDC029432 TaxID=3154599 RepID=UPI0034549111